MQYDNVDTVYCTGPTRPYSSRFAFRLDFQNTGLDLTFIKFLEIYFGQQNGRVPNFLVINIQTFMENSS